MTIDYRLDPCNTYITETWRGSVSAADLREHWEHYLRDVRVLNLRRTLVDLRDASLSFTGEELAALVRSIVVPLLGGRDWITAIVVARPSQFGVSRQYHVFAELFSQDSIFYDIDTARSWLLAQQHKVPSAP